ncbi:alpha/beta hydrolase [Paenibacillus agilis]|uniref:Alpha/beta hydrolase n=1 Tax=Paenibacillus agilis TaxID=3020863 RepID=A0A559IKZ3_9BACL|nr:alpha/beta fold hydrolase [Paenibacillus agilis]TVX88328.1 alpha/beta hydrolase [Paenibacillus agilis]
MSSPMISTPNVQPDWIAPIEPAIPARMKRVKLKHILIALLLSAMFTVVVIFLALHGFIAWMFANPQVPPLFANPMTAKGLQYENVTFPARDQHTLVEGWYIPASSTSKKTIILSHGYGANREEYWVPMYDLAHFAQRLGYNVIMFDYGFASTNHKTKATGGRLEKEQLLGAVELAKKRGSEHIVVWGFSMGAGTALQASLISDDIDAMVLDSMFLLEPDTLYHNLQQFVNLPKEPSLNVLRMMFPLLNDTSLQQIPYDEVKAHQYTIPTFFIHGTADTKAPYTIAEQIASNQDPALSSSWIVDGAHHELIYREDSKTYLRKVAQFLETSAERDTQLTAKR